MQQQAAEKKQLQQLQNSDAGDGQKRRDSADGVAEKWRRLDELEANEERRGELDDECV